MSEAVQATIVIFLTLFALLWLIALINKDDWKYKQGPLTAAIHDALQEKDMTSYELQRWIEQHRPGLDNRTGYLMLAIHSWEETGRIIRYSKFDLEKGRQRIYLQWVHGETIKTERGEHDRSS